MIIYNSNKKVNVRLHVYADSIIPKNNIKFIIYLAHWAHEMQYVKDDARVKNMSVFIQHVV